MAVFKSLNFMMSSVDALFLYYFKAIFWDTLHNVKISVTCDITT